MVIFRVIIKTILFLLLFFAFLFGSLALRLYWRFGLTDHDSYLLTQLKYNRFINLWVLWVMNVRVQIINPPDFKNHYLIVSNHTGFLDIFLMNAYSTGLFITSVEMRNTPVLGWVTDAGGCLYVERRDRSNISNEVLKIRHVLQKGFNVILYPEGTSSDGAQVLPFKRTLITAAVGVVPILPAVINYDLVNDQPMHHKYRKAVFWYGDYHFSTSIIRAFALKSINLSLKFLEPVSINQTDNKAEVAEILHERIASHYKIVPYPEGVTVPEYLRSRKNSAEIEK
jgi:1-acyl-sn-glycerol-3-phosphate acyltransferase